ncbi:Hypothetical protein NTJ_06648 [Nesidiocoris tenuis]|uniref:Uncharacterized protein n=1 Tax=Nesidiocoris tenuis TaxID=355587 RepID=A0ABN7ARC6_9HEMI|nr:Hypothetical protein NTJ_06648 [Nesidiocoris tenuis]
MPLPWKLPSDEEARELYRRIDQLITDLYNIVRSILFGPLRQPIPQGGQQEDEPNVPDLLAHLASNTQIEGDSIVSEIDSCSRRRWTTGRSVAKAADEIANTSRTLSYSIFFSMRLEFVFQRVARVSRHKIGAFCSRQFHIMISLGW